MAPVIPGKYAPFAKLLMIVGLHLGVLFTVYQLLYLSSFIKEIHLFYFRQWDAYFYASIADEGYQFSETTATNSGFFSLFSYVWKLLWKFFDAGIPGVCLFNTIAFFGGMLVLKSLSAFPGLIFYYLSRFLPICSCISRIPKLHFSFSQRSYYQDSEPTSGA